MATYTPNYGLHQWVPEDQFRRTEFNEDFLKIDTALAAKADSGSTSSTISSLQSQLSGKASVSDLNNLRATVNTKCRVVVGTYTGNGARQDISLGGTPQAVFIFYGATIICAIQDGEPNYEVTLNSTGFTLSGSGSGLTVNSNGNRYKYVALI